MFTEACETCKIYQPIGFSANLFFGDVIFFLKLEAIVFVGQILSMPFCVLRMKFGQIIEFSEDSY
jgi:hypothetical protein